MSANEPAPDSSRRDVISVRVENGPIGEFCLPENSDEPVPAVILIGGSAGGLDFARPAAQRACEAGLASLALAYWRFEGLPTALEEIPLEYFDKSIAWLMERPEMDAQRIGIVGYSRGGEGALLIASRNPAIKAVAGIVPGSHVGASIDFSDFFRLQSAWSSKGQPLPFVTSRPDRPGADWRKAMAEMPPPSVEQARRDFSETLSKPTADEAAIPVEQINGPVMLIAAGKDSVWSSELMVRFLEKRLVEFNFPHAVISVRYADAGHSFIPDAFDTQTQEDDHAGANAWRSLVNFLKQNLQN